MATASNHTNRYSREEHRKQKELLDLRKSGAAMPELDEEGKMINPHIPQYISRTPWYYGSDAPSLKHQTNTVFSDRQQNLGGMESKKVVTKSTTNIGRQWRKGSCENCGSMSHKKRDCLERPRKVSARQANVTLSEDIKIDQADLDFSSKRDRWHNDDGSSFQEVVEKHEKISEARRLAEARKVEQQLLENAQKEQQRVLRRKEKLELKIVNRKEARLQRRALKRKNKIMAKLKLNTDTETETETDATTATDAVDTMTEQDMELVDISPIEDVSSEVSSDVSDSQADDANSDVDGEKDSDEDIRDESQLVSANPSDKNKQTMRSLRIREDIPKYLRNLDLDSAYYDPKTRAMRENPYGDGKAGPDGYKGDTFLRESGLVQELSRVEAFADEAESRGEHISAYANPSLAESKYREFQQKLVEAEQAREVELEDTYGSSEIAKPLSSNVILAQSDIYVEYDSSGNVIQGQAEIIPSSKYLEDVKELNHSKVWGSYYDLGEHRWGYGCCQQTIRNVYCLAVAVQTVSDDSIPKRKIESTEEDNDQNKKIRVQ